MRYVSHAAEFYTRIQSRFGAAVTETATVAQNLPGSPSDTHAEQRGPLTWRIGSSRAYARAQELGAYIVPRRRRALRFADGTFSMHARIRAKRYLRRSAATFPRVLARRMRGGA